MIEDGDIDDIDVIDSFGCSVFLLGFVEAFISHDFRNSSTLFFLFPLFFSGVFTVRDESELGFEVMIWLRMFGWGVVSTIVCHEVFRLVSFLCLLSSSFIDDCSFCSLLTFIFLSCPV